MKFFTLKIAHKPLGIWFMWLPFVYMAIHSFRKALSLSDVIVIWPLIVVSAVALLKRKLISCLFSSMVFAIMLHKAVAIHSVVGILLFLLAFLGLIANRRWFDEQLPKNSY